MAQRLFGIVFFVCIIFSANGQAGVNFRAGVGTMITDLNTFTVEDGAHYGWKVAMFARIGASDTWFFDPGVSYEAYNIISSSEFNSFEDTPKLKFLKVYINIATFLIRTDLFKMRLTGGGELSYLARVDKNPNYKLEAFNDATLGVNGGIGFDLWAITLDLGYEYALTDFFAESDGMKNRFWTLSTGFFF